jgi:hypothetical protein
MKKLFVLFTVLMALVLFPSFSGRTAEGLPDDGGKTKAVITYSYYVTYPYYVHDGDWWTGLALYNDYSGINHIAVYVYNTSGAGGLVGTSYFTALGQLVVDSIQGYSTIGSLPSIGSVTIIAEHPFIADKFTGNSTMGGFSEVQLTSTQIQPGM